MKRHIYRAAIDPAVLAAPDRRYMISRRTHSESAQGYFEVARNLRRPCVIATMPRVSAEVEYFAPDGRKLSDAAQEPHRHAVIALAGSRPKRKEIFLNAETGVVRGVHERNVRALCEAWADVLHDPASYLHGKVISLFPAPEREAS